MPTTQTVLFPPPTRSAAVDDKGFLGISLRQWLFSLQNLLPLRVADTSGGSYSEALPPAGLNATTGQSNQNAEIIYVKSTADANTFTITGGVGGSVALAAQYQAARFKSDGTNWWNVTGMSSSGGVVFNTPGQGGFVGAGIPVSEAFFLTNTAGPPGTTPDQITVFQFQLESTWTISKVSAHVATGQAGAIVNFGLFSAAGGKLLDSGALAASGTNVNVSVTLGSSVTLSPGTYQMAQSAHFSGVAPTVSGLNPQFFGSGLPNLNAVRIGQAANSTNAGVMPATLGVVSADTIGPVMCQAFFEV